MRILMIHIKYVYIKAASITMQLTCQLQCGLLFASLKQHPSSFNISRLKYIMLLKLSIVLSSDIIPKIIPSTKQQTIYQSI